MTPRPHIGGSLVVVVGTFALAVVFGRLLVFAPSWLCVLALTIGVIGVVSLPDDDRIATANRVREALSILQIPISIAAEHYMAWDYREFKRALNGETKLDWWRLVMIGSEFRRVYAMLELRDLGLPTFAQTALKIDSALVATKRLA
jgi:hypothetical protein